MVECLIVKCDSDGRHFYGRDIGADRKVGVGSFLMGLESGGGKLYKWTGKWGGGDIVSRLKRVGKTSGEDGKVGATFQNSLTNKKGHFNI